MIAPRLTDQGRGRGVARLIVLALVQALAIGVATFDTRWLFRVVDRGVDLPLAALAGLAISGLAIALVRVLFRRHGERLGQDYVHDVRRALFSHASRTWPRDLAARRSGYLSLRFVGDLSALKDWPARGLPLLIESAVTLPAAVAILFVLEPGFGLIGAGVAVAALAGLAAVAPGLLRAHRTLRARHALLAADMTERLPLAPQLSALGRRGRELALIRRRVRGLTSAALARVTRAETLRALPDALAGLAGAAVIWRGSVSGMDTGSVAAGLAVLGLTLRPLRSLMGIVDRASAYRAAHTKLVTALARPVAADRSTKGVRLRRGPVAVRLCDLRVGGMAPVSVSLQAGELASLPSNTNADAVFRAICGLEPILGGDILLNDIPHCDLTPGSLRRSVAWISSQPIILKGSLRRTLTLGLSDRPSDTAILSRLQKQGLTHLLESLGGLDRRIGEAGRTLSPLERRDVSVLRAALARPGLLLVSHEDLLRPPISAWLDGQIEASILADS